MTILLCIYLAALTSQHWVCLAEITVFRQTQVLFDRSPYSPRLYIQGTGFDEFPNDNNHLNIATYGESPFVQEQDFWLGKSYIGGGGVFLSATHKRSWARLADRNPLVPVPIVLYAGNLRSDPKNLLAEPVIVATVIPLPDITFSDAYLQQTASLELRINGTKLIGAKITELLFIPMFTKGVQYDDVTPYPLQTNQIILRLRPGQQWRETPGPLYVTSIDTGVGRVELSRFYGLGLQVAEVIANTSPVPEPLPMPAEDPAFPSTPIVVIRQNKLIYNHAPLLRIIGTDFDSVDDELILLNISAAGRSSLVSGRDFFVDREYGDGVVVTLVPGKTWVDPSTIHPPVALVLNAVIFGAHPHRNVLEKPVVVARVLSEPSVGENKDLTVRQSADSFLVINGAGLVGAEQVALFFSTTEVNYAYEDVTNYPLRSNQIILRLRSGQQWLGAPGPLMLRGIDTGGGPVYFGGEEGIQIAHVVADDTLQVREPLLWPQPDPAPPSSTVTVLPVNQFVYEKTPTLRIRGSGFALVKAELILLNISAVGQPSRVSGRDFVLEHVSDENGVEDGIILKLMTGRTWMDSTALTSPSALVLHAVRFGAHTNRNVLGEPITVAQILPTPSFRDNNQTVSQSERTLTINCEGLMGAKKVDLLFSPPLYSYCEDVTLYPLRSNQLTLRLSRVGQWRQQPGPLFVVGVDTGNGPVMMSADGVLVANVVADCDPGTNAVTVEQTAKRQLVYSDAPEIVINGTGFSLIENKILFRSYDGIVFVNYTIISMTKTSLKLRLLPGSLWIGEEFQPVLSVAAVDAGAGFVCTRPIWFEWMVGQAVAQVFARPQLQPGERELFRTQSHELRLYGAGFSPYGSNTLELRFATTLVKGVDYSLQVLSYTEFRLTLLDGRAWRDAAGPLVVTHINALGDTDGWISLGEGVQVAYVDNDIPNPPSNAIQIFPSHDPVNAYYSQSVLVVKGVNFQAGMFFVLNPPVDKDHYTQVFVSSNTIELRLSRGRQWPRVATIVAQSVIVDNTTYPMNVSIADILLTPGVFISQTTYHESQSKRLIITGDKFTTVANTRVVLRPTPSSSYKVVHVQDDEIHVLLLPGRTWLPPFTHNKVEGKKIALQIVSIDVGAGDTAIFSQPVTVGLIVKDRDGVVCDDSCVYAFDGVCDVHHDNTSIVRFSHTCAQNTDCTDCGGVDALPDCTNTCVSSHDGVCDDPRGTGQCTYGTDCQDCGPSGAPINNTNDDISTPNIEDGSEHKSDHGDSFMLAVLVIALLLVSVLGAAIAWYTMQERDKVETGIAMSVRTSSVPSTRLDSGGRAEEEEGFVVSTDTDQDSEVLYV